MKIETALRHFSTYIRLRDADDRGICKCCTCERTGHWSTMEAGHYVKRRFKATLLDEKNAYAQCVECNHVHDGREEVMAEFIDQKHGRGTARELKQKAQVVIKLMPYEVTELGDYYREQVKYLRKKVAV